MNIFSAAVAAWRRRKWARLTEGQRQVRKAINQMSPEDRAELKRELDEGIRESTGYLRRSRAEHEARQKAIAEERERRSPEVQAAHAARMKALANELDPALAPVKYSPNKPRP